MHALIEDARAQGAWVFNGGLYPPGSATVVRQQRGDLLVTDGPFAEGKEHLGGFIVIRRRISTLRSSGPASWRACSTLPAMPRGCRSKSVRSSMRPAKPWPQAITRGGG